MSPSRKQTGFLEESIIGVIALIKASRSKVLLLRRLISQNHYSLYNSHKATVFPFLSSVNTFLIAFLTTATTSSI